MYLRTITSIKIVLYPRLMLKALYKMRFFSVDYLKLPPKKCNFATDFGFRN